MNSFLLVVLLLLDSIVGRASADEILEQLRTLAKQRTTPSIAEVNAVHIKMGLQVIEGDIVAYNNATVARGGIYFKANPWPFNEKSGHYEVPYIISNKFPEDKKKDVILYAMRLLERGTNVRFVERRNSDNDFLNIISGTGCYSFLGNRHIGSQDLSLQIGTSAATCLLPGTAVHELIHALGVGHEHQRLDRSDYVTIVWENVDPAYEDQLQVQPQLDRGFCTGYDYASIMHYGASTFAIRRGDFTIKPKYREGVYPLVSSKLAPSSCDWFELNSLYPHNGFVFKCDRHRLPETAVPVNTTTCKTSIDTLSCEEYCRMWYSARQCKLPGEFPEMPARTPKKANAKRFDDCESGWNAAERMNDLLPCVIIAFVVHVLQLF